MPPPALALPNKVMEPALMPSPPVATILPLLLMPPRKRGTAGDKDAGYGRRDRALVGDTAGEGGDADSADSRRLRADEPARGVNDAAGKIADVVYEDGAAYTAGRDLAAVGDAAGEGGNRRDDDAVGGSEDRTGIADAAGEGGNGGDENAVVDGPDRPAVADAASECRGIFNVDGVADGGGGSDAAVSCDLDAARDDRAAVNQIPLATGLMIPLSTIAPWIVLAETLIPVAAPEISPVLAIAPLGIVLEMTTMPPDPTEPVLVTPPLKLVPLTSISLVALVKLTGNGPL